MYETYDFNVTANFDDDQWVFDKFLAADGASPNVEQLAKYAEKEYNKRHSEEKYYRFVANVSTAATFLNGASLTRHGVEQVAETRWRDSVFDEIYLKTTVWFNLGVSKTLKEDVDLEQFDSSGCEEDDKKDRVMIIASWSYYKPKRTIFDKLWNRYSHFVPPVVILGVTIIYQVFYYQDSYASKPHPSLSGSG